MKITSLIKQTIIPFFTLIIIDIGYLYLLSDYFSSVIRNIQGSGITLRFVSVFFIYIILSFAIYYFILKDKRPAHDAFILGVIIYSVFDLTNHSIFKKWTIPLIVIDSLWGGILLYITTIITRYVDKIMY
jgi:uncharacterized membrane protein